MNFKREPSSSKVDSNDMVISHATIVDADALSLLFEQYLIFYQMPADRQDIKAFLTERMRNAESVIFVTRSKRDGITGFVQLYPLFSSVRLKKLWLLNDLFVHRDHRGQRLSVILIDRAKQLATETNSAGLLLETAKSNTIGNNLYKRTGFVMDTDHNYYSWS